MGGYRVLKVKDIYIVVLICLVKLVINFWLDVWCNVLFGVVFLGIGFYVFDEVVCNEVLKWFGCDEEWIV